MKFRNAELLSEGSPFEDEQGRNPFADSDVISVTDSDGDSANQTNAYAANYAADAATAGEVEIRLQHRGGTLILVGIFTAIMLLMSFVVGTPVLLVVLTLGLWVVFSASADLAAMRLGRMNVGGHSQTRAGFVLAGLSVVAAIGMFIWPTL
jgi:hypothetical protein